VTEDLDALAIVCHGGVINAVLTPILGLEQLIVFEPDYASVSRVHLHTESAAKIVCINEHAHVR
jgi:probable phosphoglycerate mutase